MLYDIIEQDNLQPKFEKIPDEYIRDGTKMAQCIAQAVENSEEVQTNEVAYFRDHTFVQPLSHKKRPLDSLILGSDKPGAHHLNPLTGRGYYDGLGFEGYVGRWKANLRKWAADSGKFSADEDLRENPDYQQNKAALYQAWL